MKKAFSFFELMIVIIIIGVVYAILIQNFTFPDLKEKKVSLENLPTFLRQNFAKNKSLVTLKCFDDCSKCKVYENREEKQEIIGLFEKYSDPKSYHIINERYQNIKFANIYKNYKIIPVCFEYNLYPNGSSDEMVLEYEDKFYVYDNFSQPTKITNSLSDIQDEKQEQMRKIKDDI